jgi:hypothetical protein
LRAENHKPVSKIDGDRKLAGLFMPGNPFSLLRAFGR